LGIWYFGAIDRNKVISDNADIQQAIITNKMHKITSMRNDLLAALITNGQLHYLPTPDFSQSADSIQEDRMRNLSLMRITNQN
jgi:hypothetical protein